MPLREGPPSNAAPAPVPPPVASPSKSELAARALLRRAERARDDLEEFFRLVMRHELTQKALEPAPHQKLGFSFMHAHERAVIRRPIGTSKTVDSIALALHLLGNDVTARGGFVSIAQKLASKPLGQVKDYIEDPILSKRLTLVFPHLQRSHRITDSWSNNAIVVDRPAGIRDPSIVAAGLETKKSGSRWSFLVADDTIDDTNTRTPEQRVDTNGKFDSRLVSRLDPLGARAYVTNTPWDREDLTYHLEVNAGWPSLSMDVYGYVWFQNVDAAWLEKAQRMYIRPSELQPGRWRLLEHDPDPEELVPLWPARYSAEKIHELRHGKGGASHGMLPQEFARLLLCEPFAHGAARCQRAWIEKCKLQGMGLELEPYYRGVNPTFCGVDLGFGKREARIGGHKASDRTVFVVFELLPDKRRRLLQVESGRWSGSEIVDRIVDYYARYRCQFAVENEGGQTFLRQWAISERRDIVIKAHSTQAKNKYHLTYGVESMFAEVQQEAWVFPCEVGTGRVHPEVQLLFDGALYYQPPPAHTSDHLIAWWIARELSRGVLGGNPPMRHRSKIEMAAAAGGY